MLITCNKKPLKWKKENMKDTNWKENKKLVIY